ncbi:MAG: tRNA (adenosine(37)-N6)-threonylcarbamoyltransferase complex ATPase subunit type 1 TsaE [Alphaproteobacteria bacterium]|nr:MAG: tRNA (adenosine(37)-N6)-threonylcarbamoyltransferase complex ATPase subunit type 1 TsaE [Alphaproteobacteria bacterium]TAF13431.1 MAG: tRNA (adenosine(37)-N6)-threonylcarbamoyltransferase complex ATPase subunit type 1 TsaE [Alphaproteobacteria bacterium]TAF40776.1 MAG: tRNA (adenosine(37)-N6)-threonylcarbamoyltransferase complex ATPase subunit type 1 TsaE [Alphaproteobacteria bacterium]TAF76956.1 MAG: tRNA (adenosine(37)-N6)-threonylcarbamoyltransferase complex ATPase subunit type 1 TsaE
MTHKNSFSSIVSQADLERCAWRLAQHAQAGDVFALSGEVGAGKTTFSQAFIRALCGEATIVTSPTFTLVHTYMSLNGNSVWHYDLYRIEHPQHIVELALEDALCDGITLIEWPEIILDTLPAHTVHITFAFDENSEYRTIRFDGDKPWTTILPHL